MRLGTCRHCGSDGIPTDAPFCRSCAGWRPNPGVITRLGVSFNRIVSLLWFLAGAILVGAGLKSPELIGAAYVGFTLFLCPGAAWLFRAFVRPYGQSPVDS